MRNESDSAILWLIAVRSLHGVHDRPMVPSVNYESRSMSVRTRKMVNYA